LPYDFAAISQSLLSDGEDTLPDLAWLGDTWRDPAAFWSALHHSSARGAPFKSRPFDRYDLYSDLIIHHLTPNRPAFASYDRRARAIKTISYAELHDLTARKAAEWLAQKVKPGATLAVVLPLGRDWLVAMLTAVRLGLVVSFLPPLGDRYLAARLKSLKPAHIATDPLYLTLLKGSEKLILEDGVPFPRPHDRSHTYASGDPCALVFSPLRAPRDEPVKLTADDAFLHALRDGVIALSLQPGDTLAAPELHPTQHHPALLFTTLLAGATFFHLTLQDLTQDPRLLLAYPLRAVGLTRAVRDLLREKPLGPVKTWSHWFKNPEEPLDAREWIDFVAAHALEDVPASNLLIDAAGGGATLFSVRRPDGVTHHAPRHPSGVSLKVVPSAGVPWALFDVDRSGARAPDESGLFTEAPPPPKKIKPAELGYVLLSAVGGGEYLYAGTMPPLAEKPSDPSPLPRREGRVYPQGEVLAAIADLPFVADASFAAVPSGGPAARALILLLVFTGAETPEECAKEEAKRAEAITRRIRSALGDEPEPDKILFFPLYARRTKKQEVDHAWCAAQFHRGSLTTKSQSQMFQLLTALRKRCVRDVIGPPAAG
jgi:hypothetical protein